MNKIRKLFKPLSILIFIPSASFAEINLNTLMVYDGGDSTCPINFTPLDRFTAAENTHHISQLIGHWDFASLDNGWVITGEGYGFDIKPGTNSKTLCVELTGYETIPTHIYAGTKNNWEIYNISSPFDKRSATGTCYAQNSYVRSYRYRNGVTALDSFDCTNVQITPDSYVGAFPANPLFAAYASASWILMRHENIFESRLFNTQLLIHNQILNFSNAGSASYHSNLQSILLDHGLYPNIGNALTDFSVIAHEIGHAHAGISSADANAYDPYMGLSEALPDLYSVLMRYDYLSHQQPVEPEIIWRIGDLSTIVTNDYSLRNVLDPTLDAEAGVRYIDEVSSSMTAHQKGGPIRYIFGQIVSASIKKGHSKYNSLKDTYNLFRKVTVEFAAKKPQFLWIDLSTSILNQAKSDGFLLNDQELKSIFKENRWDWWPQQ